MLHEKADKDSLREVQRDLTQHAAARFRRNVTENSKLPLAPDVAKLLTEIRPSLESYIAAGQEMTDLARCAIRQLSKHACRVFSQAFGALEDSQERLSTKLESVVDSTHATVAAVERRSEILQLGVLLAFGIVQLVLSVSLVRYVLRSLRSSITVANKVAAGDLSSEIDLSKRDEFGELLASLDKMQRDLATRNAADSKLAAENMRVRRALDNAATNVMIVDNSLQVVYQNAAIVRMWRSAQEDIRKAVPAFDADTILGHKIDRIEPMPHLASIASTQRSTLRKGSRTFAVSAAPVAGESGERLGVVLEWHDRTSELAVEESVGQLIDAAARGDFTRRIDLAGKEGFFRLFSESLNKLMDTNERGLNDVVEVLNLLAQGDLTQKISGDIRRHP